MSASAPWFILVGSALITGASLVGVLVARPRDEAIAGIASASAFSVSIWAILQIVTKYQRFDAMLYTVGFMLLGIGGGYSLACSLLDSLARPPHLVGPPAAPAGREAAVIVTCCYEPESYSPRATAALLRTLAEEELFQPATSSLPFLYFAQKARYRALGGKSPSRAQLASLAEKTEAGLDGVRVLTANCSGEERLAARIAQAVADGHDRIVVVELAVATSLQMAAAAKEVDAMKLDQVGVSVTFTGPVGDSERIIAGLARRMTATPEMQGSTGIVLIGQGQPENRSRLNPAYDEQETVFLNRMRLLLVESGMAENHVRIAWTEWRQPDITSAVRHLAALGCSRIIVMPATYPVDSITTHLDIELAVRQARVDDSVAVMTMTTWQQDDAVIAEIQSRATAAVHKSR